jgi:hypothetical protein
MISAKNCGTSAMWLELFKANYGCGQAESKTNLLVVGIQTPSSQDAQTISLHLKIFKKGISLDYIKFSMNQHSKDINYIVVILIVDNYKNNMQ